MNIDIDGLTPPIESHIIVLDNDSGLYYCKDENGEYFSNDKKWAYRFEGVPEGFLGKRAKTLLVEMKPAVMEKVKSRLN